MNRWWQVVVLAALGCCACGSGGGDGEQTAAQIEQALALDTGAFGGVPIPVESAGSAPKLVGGKPVQNWDGSVVELIAADAWAECSWERPLRAINGFVSPNDQYLFGLQMKMDQALCGNSPRVGISTVDWYQSRRDPACNVDPTTFEVRTLPAVSRASELSSYVVAPVGFNDTAAVRAATRWTRAEVSYAEQNLCMARRLSERLEGDTALFASSDQQLELLNVVRHRAQAAVIQYTFLSKVAIGTQPLDAAVRALSSDSEYLRLLQRWLVSPGTSAIGEDFAAAIELHARITDQLARLLLRVGSQRSPSAGVDRPTADFGPTSGRTRLLKLLYGGYPLSPVGTSEPEGAPIENFGTYDDPAFRQRHQYVREDVRRPQVEVLLGLARRANALWLRRTEQPFDEPVDNEMDFNRRRGSSFLVDQASSSQRLYREVEVDLRARKCAIGRLEFCGSALPPDTAQYLLQKLHAVSPADADSLVGMLGDAVPSRTRVELNGAPSDVYVFSGAFHVPGAHQVTPDPTNPKADWVRLDPDFFVAPLAPHEQAQAYIAPALIPRSLDLRAPGPEQGMRAILSPSFDGGSESTVGSTFGGDWERWGALPVLALAREAIEIGLQNCSAGCGLFQSANSARAVLDAATGPRTVVLRPNLEPVDVGLLPVASRPGWLTVPGSSYFKVAYIRDAKAKPPTLEWTLTTVTASNDDFDKVAFGSGNEPLRAAAITLKHQGFFGETRDKLKNLATVAPESTKARSGNLVRGYRFKLAAARPSSGSSDQNVVFLKRTPQDDFTTVRVFDFPATRNGWISTSYGGNLNDLAASSRRVQASNWSMPERDGLGIPYAWVPPADVTLAGGSPGEDSVAYYLRVARKAAEDATAAVQVAIAGVKEQELDDAALQVSEDKAVAIGELEQQGLCGAGARSGCKVDTDLWDACSDPPERKLTCLTDSRLNSLLPEVFRLASAVVRAPGPAPTFAEFSGGSLQRLLVAQWNAKEALKRAMGTYIDFVAAKAKERDAAQAVINAAQPQLDQLAKIATRECSQTAFDDALGAGRSYPDVTRDSTVVATGTGAWFSGGRHKGSTAWSPGPIYAQISVCHGAQDQAAAAGLSLPVQTAQATATIEGIAAAVGAQLGAISDARGALLTTIVDLNGVTLQSQLATARLELERQFGRSEVARRFAIRRKFQNYDLWRARALLESARKLAVTARRAVEGRFGVDLSELSAAEAFVASPALWADEVYGTDLDAPKAVGLTQLVTSSKAVEPNKLLDYVNNLELFVKGYAINRPTSVARGDTEVVELPAPEGTRLRTLDGKEVTVLDPTSSAWLFFCDSTKTWISHPGTAEAPLVSRLGTACGGKPPVQARLNFGLDAWGRLNGDYALPPFEQRHNARWSRLAVNLVGTGIRNCAAAADPASCYNQAFLRFDLRHGGPAWITNYAQEWRALGVSSAFVESGKALSAEEWLDPIANTWTAPLVSNVARQELIERPMGGQYELVLEVTPDVRLDRIERVQLLAETNYWVAQTR